MIFSPSAIQNRKSRAGKNLEKNLKDGDTVIIASGKPIQKPGGHDQTYPFLAHPDYFWISGSRRPHGLTVFTKEEGWIDFVLPVTREEKIWEGGADVIPGRDIREFEGWFSRRNPAQSFILGQLNDYPHLSGASEEQRADIQEALNEVRRIKDQEEVDLVIKLASYANHGYEAVKKIIRPGISERDIQIEYETAVLKAGAHKMPYDSIVGTGTNAAILHAIPTSRIVKEGDLVLIDAGADVDDYCVDITRVFPANGKKSDQQKMIYDLVLKAQLSSIAMMKPGTDWKDIHLNSARVMAQGLRELNILNVDAEEALNTGTIGVFFPHGVGHMVGLRVRDVGGRVNPQPKIYGGSRVRVDMPIEEGFLMTVEPGLYFIEALLEDDQTKEKHKKHINWMEVAKWKNFGGVRIEDDILVTKNGPRNLTEIVPK
jgi:Xaa-Pro aminopeptidase